MAGTHAGTGHLKYSSYNMVIKALQGSDMLNIFMNEIIIIFLLYMVSVCMSESGNLITNCYIVVGRSIIAL